MVMKEHVKEFQFINQ